MALQEYHRKRDFKKTAEPRGKKIGKAGHHYLIQKHAASHLHYDFRLELDGVLKSWAVPKGPSVDPADKRLAVHVEDHPLEYGGFEGTIPKGEYGGGTVMLWDQGEWEPLGDPREAYRKGNLKFKLYGTRLKGEWHLVRMHGRSGGDGKNWLLFHVPSSKRREANPRSANPIEKFVRSVESGRTMEEIKTGKSRVWSSRGATRPAAEKKPVGFSCPKKRPMPEAIAPQLATLVKEAPSGDEWVFETKFDGYRILAFIADGEVSLISRNGKDWTDRFPNVVEAVKKLPIESAVIDGEMVVGKGGRADFQKLQNALLEGSRMAFNYYAFDLVYLNGYDLQGCPLLERKAALQKLLHKAPAVLKFSTHVAAKGVALFKKACEKNLEGLIAKRADASYEQRRSQSWLKVKCIKGQEFIIVGYTDPSGSRTGFGALVLAVHEGKVLRYCGNVGTGFSNAMLQDLHTALVRLQTDHAPQMTSKVKIPARSRIHWVKPQLICEVEFTEWTQDGLLRHPAFRGIREDKAPAVIKKEESDAIGGVTLTHPERVLFKKQNLTKRDLALYYESIQKWILPHIVERPLSLVRCPEGEGKECFFQKHVVKSMPKAIDSVRIREKSGSGDYIVIHDLAGLISLPQMGVLEIHPWPCKASDIESPDRLVIDLDPDPSVAWSEVVKSAKLLEEIFSKLKLRSFVRTTGGKGLHVVVPLNDTTWAELESFAKSIAEGLVRYAPDRFIATMSKAKRKGKIFVDYLRNRRGATAIAPYSTRARPGATVAMPLDWKDLRSSLDPQKFTVKTVPKILARRKTDPWKEIFKVKQSPKKKSLPLL